MNKAIIISKFPLASAARVFKKSLVYDGVNRTSKKNHKDRVMLQMLINLDKSISYDHVIMLENFNPNNLSMLTLGESDYYYFDATPENLKKLRKTYKELVSTGYIVKKIRELCEIRIPKIFKVSSYKLKLENITVTQIKIEAIIRMLTDFINDEYNSYCSIVMVERDKWLVHQP